MKLKELDVYFVKGVQTKKNLKSNNEDKVTRFVFMTSIPVTVYNYRAIFKTGQDAFCILRSALDTFIKRDLNILNNLKLIANFAPE